MSNEVHKKLVPALIYKSIENDAGMSVCRFDKKIQILRSSKLLWRPSYKLECNNNNDSIHMSYVSCVHLKPKVVVRSCNNINGTMSESIDGEIYRNKVNITRQYVVQSNFYIEPIDDDIHHPYPYDSDEEREFHSKTWKSTVKFFIEDQSSSELKIPQTPQIVKFRNHILFKD